jgi:hypothetical protein
MERIKNNQGYVYMPYKPCEVVDVSTNIPKKTIKSRYATTMIDNRFYSTINIPSKQKEIKRIYSELDPFGEEDWEE